MRIAISGFPFTTEPGKRYAGVGRNMARVLEEIVRKDRGDTYHIFINSKVDLDPSWENCKWITWHRVEVKGVAHRLFWEHFLVGKQATKLGCDLVHSLFANLPFGCKLPMTTLVHDAFPRTHPQWYTPRNRRILDWMTASGCRLATHVLTVSEFARTELNRAYGTPLEKITVCYNGPGNDVQQLTEAELISVSREGLPDLDVPFVFTVSTLEPRKNLSGLIRAFESVPQIKLYVAGAKGWLNSELAQVVENSPARDRIVFLGYVSDEQLNLLLNKCKLFALVSFVEGFGIPVLEAMIAGAPVVTSQTSSLPEVAGGWAYYCDPENPASIAEALLFALGNEEELSRKAAGGKEFATQFTWEASVDRMHQVFHSLVGR
ncbi:MAG: glycosyltransferase family 1 protein [Armatimonadota bacterium]